MTQTKRIFHVTQRVRERMKKWQKCSHFISSYYYFLLLFKPKRATLSNGCCVVNFKLFHVVEMRMLRRRTIIPYCSYHGGCYVISFHLGSHSTFPLMHSAHWMQEKKNGKHKKKTEYESEFSICICFSSNSTCIVYGIKFNNNEIQLISKRKQII